MTMKKRVLFLIISLCLSVVSVAQMSITGTITDTNGSAIPGATVVEKGTTRGVISDFDGNYTIEVAGSESVLVFSFIGKRTQEINAGGQSQISVVLVDDLTDLDEVVVVGYGVQRKRLTTGATVQVGADDIVRQNSVSPMTALQGQTPGVNIVKETGEPGSGFKVNIRGMGTVGNSQPLYVIDGVPGGNIDYLSPSDIESIDVLKDAASAAIYGSRAANGVILVTTKRGSSSDTQGIKKGNITYDGSYGFQNLYKKLPVANAQEYAVLLNEARVNSGMPMLDYAGTVPNWDKIESGEWTGTDWMDALTVENAPVQNHALNMFGGGHLHNYSMGLSYTDHEGIFGGPVNSHYQRYTFRVNSDFVLVRDRADSFDILKFGETLRYSNTDQTGIGTGNQYWNDVFTATTAIPFMPLYNEEGDYHYAIPFNRQFANPIGQMEYTRGYNQNKGHNLNGSVYMELQPIKNLKYRSQFGYNMSAGSYRSYTPVYDLSATAFNNSDQVSHNMNMGYSWTFENVVTYDLNTAQGHNFNFLLGTSAEKWGMGENISGSNINSLMPGFAYAYLENTPTISDRTSLSSSKWADGALLSYFGRVNYDYKEKYMATVIVRADGSSNFAQGNRWGIFPSVSAGWVITEEDFMSGAGGVLDFLKFRGSWGQNGNQAIDPFQYLATISFENVNYFFGPSKGSEAVSVGGYPNILPNPDVTWETSEQLNLGFDAYLFNSRLGVAFDWYNKSTKDWLVRADNLASFGTGSPFINGGDIVNTGVELALNWNDRAGDLRYSFGANVAYNQNEVTRIANNEGVIYGPGDVLGQGTNELYRVQVGYPIGFFRGYETLGVFQNQEEIDNYKTSDGRVIMPNAQPGDLIFNDRNDDGNISDADKTMIGDPNPDFVFGLNLNLDYKGFDFSMRANGAAGFQIARSLRRWNDSPQNNYTTDIFNRWHGEGSSNHYPRLTYGAHPNWQYVSDIFIEDGDYLRISNVTLGYDFKKIFTAMPLEQARFYVSVQNLYTFTNYSGMDPEIGTSTTGDDWAKGVDIGYYPSPRTVLVGVSIKF